MYLWSIEIEAVLTAMSCFEFLCEEADILYSGDEQVIHFHLPNYSVYQQIAGAYKDLTTGMYDYLTTGVLIISPQVCLITGVPHLRGASPQVCFTTKVCLATFFSR